MRTQLEEGRVRDLHAAIPKPKPLYSGAKSRIGRFSFEPFSTSLAVALDVRGLDSPQVHLRLEEVGTFSSSFSAEAAATAASVTMGTGPPILSFKLTFEPAAEGATEVKGDGELDDAE